MQLTLHQSISDCVSTTSKGRFFFHTVYSAEFRKQLASKDRNYAAISTQICKRLHTSSSKGRFFMLKYKSGISYAANFTSEYYACENYLYNDSHTRE